MQCSVKHAQHSVTYGDSKAVLNAMLLCYGYTLLLAMDNAMFGKACKIFSTDGNTIEAL